MQQSYIPSDNLSIGFKMFEIKSVGNTECFVKKHPVVLLPICVLTGSIVYGSIFVTLFLFFPISDGDSLAWVALLLGFLGLFIIPDFVEFSLTRLEFLSLVFFVHGAVAGFISGLAVMFMVYWKNFPDGATKTNK